MELDITRRSEPVTFSSGEKLTLWEATEEAARQYRNACISATKRNEDAKTITIEGLADTQSLLVHLCLVDQDGKQVSLPTIRSWPTRVTKALFEKAKDLSDLGEKEEIKKEQDAKN